jgi:hypothetical protein
MIISSMDEITVDNYYRAQACFKEVLKKWDKHVGFNLKPTVEQVFDFGKEFPEACTCASDNTEYPPYTTTFNPITLGTLCLHKTKHANPDYKCWKKKFCLINQPFEEK